MAAASKERVAADPSVPKQRGGGGGGGGEEGGAQAGGRKRLMLVGGAVVLVLALVVGWFFFLGPGASSATGDGEGGEEAAAEGEEGGEEGAGEEHDYELGAVLSLEPTTINLADGHYLQLGMALQFVVAEGGGHGGEPDGSQALDIAIRHYSGTSMAELSDPEVFEQRKQELVDLVYEAYHHEVVDVYFTAFVMQ